MPTLSERRAAIAASGGQGASGDFIKFKTEGETKLLRFLFTDADSVESHKKFWDETEKRWLIDDQCPEGKGAYRIVFNLVEYDAGGANPRRVRWELSEYLYNEYLSPYIEKDVPASKNVWQIKVRRPGTMDVSYVAFRVEDATEATYPIPEATAQSASQPAAQPATPTYTQPVQAAQVVQPAAQPTVTPVQQAAPVAEQPVQPAPRKSKYF